MDGAHIEGGGDLRPEALEEINGLLTRSEQLARERAELWAHALTSDQTQNDQAQAKLLEGLRGVLSDSTRVSQKTDSVDGVVREKLHGLRAAIWDASCLGDRRKFCILGSEDQERLILLPFSHDLAYASENFEHTNHNPFKRLLWKLHHNPLMTPQSRHLRERFEQDTYGKRVLAGLRHPDVETAIALSGSTAPGVATASSDIDTISYVRPPPGADIPTYFIEKGPDGTGFTGKEEGSPLDIRQLLEAARAYRFWAGVPAYTLDPQGAYSGIPGSGSPKEVGMDVGAASLFGWSGVVQETEGTIDGMRRDFLGALAQNQYGESVWNDVVVPNWRRIHVMYEKNMIGGKDRRARVDDAIRDQVTTLGLGRGKPDRALHLINQFRSAITLPALSEMCAIYDVA